MIGVRERDTTPPAPGELELVQRFMNLHEHAPNGAEDLPPSGETLEVFLRERGLLEDGEPFTEADRGAALELHAALHAKVRANAGGDLTDRHLRAFEDASRRAGLRPRLGRDGASFEVAEAGVAGALGRILAVALLADLDGSWRHLKECAGAGCRSVFFDRSRNRSGRWCSMAVCGNRAKVRAWRERRRADPRA